MKEPSNQINNPLPELAANDAAVRERIEKRAFHLWLRSGAGHGKHLNHWLQAEGEVLKAIQQEQAQRSSVPQNRPAAKQRSSPLSNEAIPNQ